eukprot:6208873-Pleurochrysis_carterae.AAC.7
MPCGLTTTRLRPRNAEATRNPVSRPISLAVVKSRARAAKEPHSLTTHLKTLLYKHAQRTMQRCGHVDTRPKRRSATLRILCDFVRPQQGPDAAMPAGR